MLYPAFGVILSPILASAAMAFSSVERGRQQSRLRDSDQRENQMTSHEIRRGLRRGPAPSTMRKAIAVDPETKTRNLKRLRRIEGQVRGLQKMVEEDRYCADILTQISSVHEALRSVGRELMRNHLKHCATEAIGTGGRARKRCTTSSST